MGKREIYDHTSREARWQTIAGKIKDYLLFVASLYGAEIAQQLLNDKRIAWVNEYHPDLIIKLRRK